MHAHRFSLRTLFALGIVLLLALPTSAQPFRTLDDDPWCDRDGWSDDGDREHFCEVRETTLAANRSLISIDGRQNGGIRVEGWNRDEILVRAKVKSHARSLSTARDLVDAVDIQTGRTIYAEIPKSKRDREWVSVSFEVFVPRQSNLDLETHNGGISISNVAGDVAFNAVNGGVSLSDLAGDIRGRTTNGGLDIELAGHAWEGDGMDVETTNGGVSIYVPDDYSARLETRTVNGRLNVDFPVTVQGRIDRRITTELGRGGNTIRAITTNGSVEVRKS